MLSQKDLKYCLYYNPKTGIFRWRISLSMNVFAGSIAGSLDKQGYIVIKVNGKNYKAHRLAYRYMIGKVPNDEIDHKDHIRHNNRWKNLREVSRSENCKNASKYKNNTSGTTGVSWKANVNKWRARIRLNKKDKHLGLFSTKKDAIFARKQAEIKYNFHENHGK